MDKNVEARLKSHVSFPSPPGVAQRIIMLANDPEVQFGAVAEVLSQDPGLAAKILRIANSALYARRRRSDNLRQALTVLGLKAATTLALSFSIAPLFSQGLSRGLDYSRCWRRALLSAVAARTLGEQIGIQRSEDLFLAGLLQDLAMLALDRTHAGFYGDVPAEATHEEFCQHEVKRLGVDHAEVGGWLLNEWRLPEFICTAVRLSHSLQIADVPEDAKPFVVCVGLGGELAEVLLTGKPPSSIKPIEARARTLLGLQPQQVGEVVTALLGLLPEIEQLFDAHLLDAAQIQSLIDHARELLTIRNLEALAQVADLEAKTDDLQHRTAMLQDETRRDALTGLFNRRHLEIILAQEFEYANRERSPLSLVFIDLDHFKKINDTFGHPAGDAVLRSTAKVLLHLIRGSDFVARYGGEEFVIVLPGMEGLAARILCERINQTLRQTTHEIAQQTLIVTASLGLAVHDYRAPFPSMAAMLKGADEALYLAKKAGRDRFCCHIRAQETWIDPPIEGGRPGQ